MFGLSGWGATMGPASGVPPPAPVLLVLPLDVLPLEVLPVVPPPALLLEPVLATAPPLLEVLPAPVPLAPVWPAPVPLEVLVPLLLQATNRT
jgi:hypothetical protein